MVRVRASTPALRQVRALLRLHREGGLGTPTGTVVRVVLVAANHHIEIAATYKIPPATATAVESRPNASARCLLSDLRLPGRRREPLLRLRCLLLLLATLLLLLLRHVMSDHTADSCAGHGMMTGYMPGKRPSGGAFQATLSLSCTCAKEQSQTRQSRYQHLFHDGRHGRTPVA